MEFLLQDYERYLMSSIKKEVSDKTIKYGFIYDDRIILMRKSRKYYQILASSSCGFAPIFSLKTLDVIYQTLDITDCLNMYHSYIIRLMRIL